ncbi:MAG: tetratricopeptide repeat protein, partial [Planctomycetota bacterium]
MLFHSRIGVWLVAAASLAALASGCSLAPKTDALSAVKAAAKQQPVTGSATPGSAEFSSNKELKNPVKVHLAYALWHEQQGNQVDARNSYNEVLKKNSKNIDALLGLARLDMQLSRMSDAEARLQKAQKVAPKNPQVVAAVGQFYAVQKDWPRALEQMRAARILSPYEPTYAFQLGVVQARSGDMVSALASFTEAVGPAEAHYNLGVIYQEQGQSAEAENHLQQALALKSDLPQAQKLLSAVRQQRQGDKSNLAKTPAANE